ncbi:hypothetical protein TSUD_291670 [Trifolium subterraneum]|uniref:Uncharacterized protein n=1 Tax=Trifolium subterraneum TaxID=3900 RepID=A0A2Z6PFD5_TRISU|nr:hypothetical protein TSUD_291670 [Trifolium subterraneum]
MATSRRFVYPGTVHSRSIPKLHIMWTIPSLDMEVLGLWKGLRSFWIKTPDSLSVRRESLFLNQSCLNWINSLISHNSSGHAFSSLLSIFPYAMMEMEYLGSAEF